MMFLRSQPRPAVSVTKALPTSDRHRTRQTLLAWLALAVGLAMPGLHAAPTQYSQGNPSDAEEYLLLQLNRARRDPVGEGQRLAAWLRNDSIGREIVVQYGTDPDQVAAALAALPSVPPLAFDADLIAAARSHSSDLAAHDGVGPGGTTVHDDGNLGAGGIPIGHLGYDGSTPSSRVDASGFRSADGSSGLAGENFDSGSTTPDTTHAGYLVD